MFRAKRCESELYSKRQLNQFTETIAFVWFSVWFEAQRPAALNLKGSLCYKTIVMIRIAQFPPTNTSQTFFVSRKSGSHRRI